MRRIGKKRWQTLVRKRETFLQKALLIELELRSIIESRLTGDETDYLDSVWFEKAHMMKAWIEEDFEMELNQYKEASQ